MNDWERQRIQKVLPALIYLTVVHSLFLAILHSKDILSHEDVKYIRIIGYEQGILRQADHLYKILMTRNNGYEVLKHAFLETNQTGALQCLLNAEAFEQSRENDKCKPERDFDRKTDSNTNLSGEKDELNETEAETGSVDTGSLSSDDSRHETDDRESSISLNLNTRKFQKCPNGLTEMLSNSQKSFILIGTMNALLTVEKINNSISDMSVKEKKIGLWRQMKIFLSDWKTRACRSGNEMMPLLVLHDDNDSIPQKRSTSIQKVVLKLFSVLKAPVNFKIVFVVNAKEQSEVEDYKLTFFGNSDQVGALTDTFSWSKLTENWRQILLARKIADQGQLRTLREVCDFHVYEQQDMFRENLLNGQQLLDLFNNELPVLFRQTIPPVNYYIKRKLRTRWNISLAIFQTSCEKEICVFTGYDSVDKWEEMSNGCRGIADTTGSQLAQDKITAHFILMSMSGDFEKIVRKAGPDQSVQLIYYGKETLMWIYTEGKHMKTLEMSMCDEKPQKEIPEENIFKEFESRSLILQQFQNQVKESTIILTDSPGMGKSVLLAKLAERTRKLYSNRKEALVFYFVMTDFIAAILKRLDQKAAQHYKDKSMLELQITKGFDINAEDTFGNTPIFYALRHPNASITNSHIRFLHLKGADFLHRNKKGETLMHVAAQFGKVKSIQLLFQLGFSVAAFNQRLNSIFISLTDCKGNTALHYALRNNLEDKWDIFKVLVDQLSGDLNQLNRRGECSLHYALKSKNVSLSVEIIEYLVQKINHLPEEFLCLILEYVEKIGSDQELEDLRSLFLRKSKTELHKF